MKIVITSVVLMIASGCAAERLTTSTPEVPASPPLIPVPRSPVSPGPAPLITLWGFVVADHGGCVDSATVRIIQGQGLDQEVAQETPCDAWGYSGGFQLRDLVPGQSLTIRAQAPGYESGVRTLIPQTGSQTTFSIALTRRP
jgi:hypothetical protein